MGDLSQKIYQSPEIHGPHCFGCGKLNNHGMRINFSFDENSGQVLFMYRSNNIFQGCPGYMHGGILSTLLDEAQGSLCHYLGYIVMTDRLRLKYYRAVPVEAEFTIRASLEKLGKKRIYTIASIESNKNKVLHVSSRASWYILNEKIIKRTFFKQKDKFNKNLDFEIIKERLNYYREQARKNKVLAHFFNT